MTLLLEFLLQAFDCFGPLAHEMLVKLPCSQDYNCGIDSDDVHYIGCLGPEMDESSEENLERFFVFFLTRKEITLGQLRTLEALEI
jgi:hypothetical protein